MPDHKTTIYSPFLTINVNILISGPAYHDDQSSTPSLRKPSGQGRKARLHPRHWAFCISEKPTGKEFSISKGMLNHSKVRTFSDAIHFRGRVQITFTFYQGFEPPPLVCTNKCPSIILSRRRKVRNCLFLFTAPKFYLNVNFTFKHNKTDFKSARLSNS